MIEDLRSERKRTHPREPTPDDAEVERGNPESRRRSASRAPSAQPIEDERPTERDAKMHRDGGQEQRQGARRSWQEDRSRRPRRSKRIAPGGERMQRGGSAADDGGPASGGDRGPVHLPQARLIPGEEYGAGVIPRELPPPLQAAIDELVRGADRGRLETAAVGLTKEYRQGRATRAARTREDVLAYAAQRAPATYAAAVAVLTRVREQRPGWRPRSLLDVGAGPGTASWAAREVWPELERIVLVEAEPAMLELGRELTPTGAEWIAGELDDAHASGSFDLVLAGYVLNELPDEDLGRTANSLWTRTGDTLVVLEPGTPAGYGRVLAVRAAVLEAGGITLAPCPHDRACPLAPSDWCHFPVRLQRSESHRAVKAVGRGFEDEKYSYAVLTRAAHPRVAARIVRAPQIRTGHVLLDLCEPEGVSRITVSKRARSAYRRARKAAWGDSFEVREQ